jgi:F0F1-type ATP synthase epsilon subunit
MLEVKEYKNVLLVDIAGWPEEIDRETVIAAKQQAEEKIKNAQFKFEIDKAKEDLRHAELRLKILSAE